MARYYTGNGLVVAMMLMGTLFGVSCGSFKAYDGVGWVRALEYGIGSAFTAAIITLIIIAGAPKDVGKE